jgi:hypothetical protein
MSVLMHLCRGCRHRATSHDGGDRGYSSCRCCLGPGDIDPEPVLVETFRCPGGQPEALYRPGTLWNAGTTHRLELCSCTRCHQRYAELTAAQGSRSGASSGASSAGLSAVSRSR